MYKILDGYCNKLNINIYYVLQFSEKKITNIGRIKKLPTFYEEKLCAFNECKANPVKMSSDETMQHPIWNNYIFNLKEIHYSSKTLVLRVKSLFSENGNFNELMNLQIKKVSQIGNENVNVNVKIKVCLL